jgi:hypothetical protein
MRCNNNCKTQLVKKERKKKKKRKRNKNTTAPIETNVKTRGFHAGLLARSQFASGRSCDRPTRSKSSVVFLGPREKADMVPKFHVALHAFHAALPMVTLQILPYTIVTLTLTLVWITCSWGIWVMEPYTEK